MENLPPLERRLLDAVERLGQGRRAFLQSLATRRGLSPLQIEVVVALDDGVDPPVAGELARRLDVTAPTIADALAALRRKSLVTEAPDPGDGRRRLLHLTDQGHALAEAVDSERSVLARTLDGLDPQAKGAALEVVLTLIADLQAQGIIAVDRSCKTCRFREPRPEHTDFCQLLQQDLVAARLRVVCPEHQPRPAQAG